MKITHGATASSLSKAELRTNNVLQSLEGKTPAEISAWVDTNVTTVNDMKTFIKFMLMVIQSLELNK